MCRSILSTLFPQRPPLPINQTSTRPRYSPIYHYSRKLHRWIGRSESPSKDGSPLPSQLNVLSWNVGFAAPMRRQRLDRILAHISETLFNHREPPSPCIILLQEVHFQALPLLLAHPIVRALFGVSTISPATWPVPHIYGNVTLVATSIPVRTIFTVDFASSVSGRHAVFADINLASYAEMRISDNGSNPSAPILLALNYVVRVANVQCE